MLGSYGGIAFGVSNLRVCNPRDLKRDSGARYATHEVIGAKPVVEYLGPGLDTLSFSLHANAYQGVSPVRMERILKQMADYGIASYFILGGRVLGNFLVTSLSSAYDLVTGQGSVIAMKLDVQMQEYR